MVHTKWFLKILFKEPIAYLSRWLKNLKVSYQNPGITVNHPTSWSYDDIQAIDIGSEVYVGPFSRIVVQACTSKSKIAGRLTISDRVIINSHANILAAGGEIYIGHNTILAQQVSLVAANHSIATGTPYRDLPWDEVKTGIYIAENVWIGAGVTILPGCHIGKNSIVGAGSVVTKSIPNNEIWAGVPAQKIRDLNLNQVREKVGIQA